MSVVTSGGPSGSVADPELLRARVVHARRENSQRRKLDIMKKGLLHKPLAVPRLLHDFLYLYLPTRIATLFKSPLAS